MSDLSTNVKITLDADAYSAGMRKIEAITKEFSSQLTGIGDASKKAGTLINSVFNVKSDNQLKGEIIALKNAYTALEKSGVASTNELARAQVALKQRTRELNLELKGTTESLESIKAAGLATATAVIGSTFKRAASDAITLNDALIGIKQVGGFENVTLDKLRGDIQALSREIPLTTSQLAEITKGGVQANIPINELKDYTKLVAQVSSAFEILPEAASESFGKIGNVYRLAVKDIGLVADAINKIADSTASVKEVDLTNVVQRAAGAGQAFGITAQQVTALGASLLSFGSAPEVAGSSINSLLNTLAAANTGTKDFKDAMGKLGFSVTDFSKLVAKDGQGALLKLLETLATLDKTSQNNAIGQLFGKGEDAQAILKLINNLELYKSQLDKVAQSSNYAGSVQQSFNTSLEKIGAQFQLLKNNVSEGFSNLGAPLVPLISVVTSVLSSIATGIAEVVKFSPLLANVGLAIAGVGAAFGALKIGGAALAGLGIAFPTLAAGATAFGAALLPIAVVLGRIALVAAAAWAAFKVGEATFSAIKEKFNATFISIGGQTQKLSDVVKASFDILKNATASAFNTIKNSIFEKIGAASKFFSGAWANAINVLNNVQNGAINVFNNIKNYAADAFNSLGGFATQARNNILSALSGIGNFLGIDILGGASTAFNSLVSMAQAAMARIKGAISGVLGVVNNQIANNKKQEISESKDNFRRQEIADYNNKTYGNVAKEVKKDATGGKVINFGSASKIGGGGGGKAAKIPKSDGGVVAAKNVAQEQKDSLEENLQQITENYNLAIKKLEIEGTKLSTLSEGALTKLTEGFANSTVNLTDLIGARTSAAIEKFNNENAILEEKGKEILAKVQQIDNALDGGKLKESTRQKYLKQRAALVLDNQELTAEATIKEIKFKEDINAIADFNKLTQKSLQEKLNTKTFDLNIQNINTNLNQARQQLELKQLKDPYGSLNDENYKRELDQLSLDAENAKSLEYLKQIDYLKLQNTLKTESLRLSVAANNNSFGRFEADLSVNNTDKQTEFAVSQDESINTNLKSIADYKININDALLANERFKTSFSDILAVDKVFSDNIKGSFSELIANVNNAGEVFKNLFKNILKGLADIAAKKATAALGDFIQRLKKYFRFCGWWIYRKWRQISTSWHSARGRVCFASRSSTKTWHTFFRKFATDWKWRLRHE